MLTLTSCTPEEIEFPEENEIDPTLFSQSNAIISLFNEINQGTTDLSELCFEFLYPVTFKTASDVILEIESEEGLQELIESQTSGFFVNQVSFPLTIFANEEMLISNEFEFQEKLHLCNIDLFPRLLSVFHGECLELEYPLTITIDSAETTEVDSFESLTNAFEDQSPFFLLDFSYPVNNLTTGQAFQNDFELFSSLNECQSCPGISFETFQSDVEVTIEASVERIEEVENFSWFINDQVFEGDGNILMNDYSINLTETIDAPGTFEICLTVEYKYCDDLLSFCDEIVIEEKCPEEFVFETEQIDQTSDSIKYLFEIKDFEFLEDSKIEWYVNDELVQSGSTEENLELERKFSDGNYTICAKYFSDFCLTEVEFCRTIVVDIPEEDPCPDLFFAFQQVENNRYQFFADFEGIETLEYYSWVVDGAFLEDEGTSNDGDNQFEFTFNEPGTHTVCIFTETPECPEGAEYCVQIEIR